MKNSKAYNMKVSTFWGNFNQKNLQEELNQQFSASFLVVWSPFTSNSPFLSPHFYSVSNVEKNRFLNNWGLVPFGTSLGKRQ